MRLPLITLLTDFGTQDAYVASMKGVILSLNPKATIVDITHEVKPQDILQASFLLFSCYSYFPKDTIHMVVVDPDVGSERRILCVKTPHALFLAPDNGVLTYALELEKDCEVREVASAAYFFKESSYTFHGRDQFAPLAAHLSKRPKDYAQLGPIIKDYKKLHWPNPKLQEKKIEGQVLFEDRFGNFITNIDTSHLEGYALPPRTMQAGGSKIDRWVKYYAEVPKGTSIALINSNRFVEIAVSEENARDVLGLCPGDPVILSWEEDH